MAVNIMLVAAVALGVGIVLWLVLRRERESPPEWRAPADCGADAPETPAVAAYGGAEQFEARRSAAALDALLREEEAEAPGAPELFALPGPPLPPLLVAGLKRLSAGAAGGEALRRLQNPDVSALQLADAIAADPVLTGHVLKIANSPLFGLRASVSSLQQAIGTMGLTNLRMLLFSELLESAGARAGLATPLRRELWPHLGATAVLARHIAPAFPGLDAGALFTAGILHDIGRLALYGPGDTAFLDDLRAETARFGVNHAVAGGVACRAFELPQSLCEGVRLHHVAFFVEMEDLDAAVDDIRLALALGLADRLAHSLGEGGGGILDEAPRETVPPVLASYRFLVRPAVLGNCLRDARLYADLARTDSLLRMGTF
jgi:HD-like signal output (HDOD) protein